jgi:hypothetical protein
MYYFITMLFFMLFCYYTLEYVETLLVNIQDVVHHTSEHELCVSWRKRVLVEISFTCDCEWVFLVASLCS